MIIQTTKVNRAIMDNYANESCWGITAWAVAIFCAVIFVAFMYGSGDAGTVVAASVSN